MSFDESPIKNASALTRWEQTTEQDFNNGTLTNVTVTPDGNVTLALQMNYVEDDYIDELKIDSRENVIIDTIADEVKLEKFSKTFGGGSTDRGLSVQQTSDDGYIIAGYTNSYGAGLADAWLIKTDETGAKQWDKTFGGTEDDKCYSVQQTIDGGYILTGSTVSYGAGPVAAWLIKVDSSGNEQWNKTYGGVFDDWGKEVQQTTDNGYIIVGYTYSFGAGSYDVWLIKTDSFGNEQWNKTFGGVSPDHGKSIQQTSDNGYIIAGYTSSFGAGDADVWLIKTDSSGTEQWSKTFGGSTLDYSDSVQQTNDGGYIIVGGTDSFSISVSPDIWLIKTDSSGSEQWNKTYGGSDWDDGFSVNQTSDSGYIITGLTYSYGAGDKDVWLIMTDSFGNEKWNKTYGSQMWDEGDSIHQTSDGGIVITGYTEGSGGEDVWLIKTNKTGFIPNHYGELTSTNLLAGQEVHSIESFNCTTSLPVGTSIKTQFSQNSIEWYNSGGLLNGWDNLSDGFNSIDLSTLGWFEPDFYYRMNFSSEGIDAPSVQNINLSFEQYHNNGSLESQPFDAGEDITWISIYGSYLFSLIDDVQLQIRTALTQFDLTGKDFVGPDGTTSTYYTPFMDEINATHNGDPWIQYMVYLSTTDLSFTPILRYVRINYNHIPDAPNLNSPGDGIKINNVTPSFTWTFNDVDGTQDSYQVLIDDDNGFGSVDYDSGIVNSGTSMYTPVSPIADGIWYWKVRTKDNDGDWGLYSSAWNITIDVTPPNTFNPSADPGDWTINTQPVITFSTTDATTDINYYEVKVDSGSFTTETSPYTLPSQTDGTHTVTVRAYDLAGNYRDGTIDVYFDTTPPNEFTPTVDPSSWNVETQPELMFSTTDATSNIDHYEVKVESGSFTTQSSPYTLPSLADGVHTIYVRAYDLAGNYREEIVNAYVDTFSPNPFIPTAEPSGWTNNIQPIISFVATDAISDIDHYDVKVDSGSFTTQTSPYTLTSQVDGIHNISVRAYDMAGNYIDGYVNVYIDTAIPSITHTDVSSGIAGEPINITAVVTDSGSGVGNVILYYKKPTETTYAELQMIGDGSSYSAEIFGTVATSEGLEYYIMIEDNAEPTNVIYFGGGGQTQTVPDSTNDIDIDIIEEDTFYPSIIHNSPDGSNVPVNTKIKIGFSEAMDETSVENAFSISPNVNGVFTWEGATVTFTPTTLLTDETQYNVSISTQAKNLDGIGLKDIETWSFFTGTEEVDKEERSFWDQWEPIITGLTIMASLIAFLIGFIAIRRKRGKLRQYMERIDDTFNEYKKEYQTCEQELIALREDIKKDVKKGKIEENHFLILDKKIDDYLLEMKVQKEGGVGSESIDDISGTEQTENIVSNELEEEA
jgi:hypothetical protein